MNQNTIRSYFYRLNGDLCSQPQQLRQSSSKITGCIPDSYGYNWQKAADVLHGIGKICGSIVKINLSKSNTYQGYIDFTIFYDDKDAAKKLYDLIGCLKELPGMINIYDLVYVETPTNTSLPTNTGPPTNAGAPEF